MNSERSEAQKQAARLNGARSQGPTSDAGKAHSARNATTHGLSAQAILLPGENPDHFAQLFQTLAHEFDAQSDAEMLCIEQMAVAQWKIRRVWNLEATAVRLSLDQQAPTRLENPDPAARLCQAWADSEKQLASLAHHDTRLQRQYTRAINHLQRLRQNRKKQIRKNEPEREAA